jgi:RNA polymerase sigma-70 factor (ECF subfamily)
MSEVDDPRLLERARRGDEEAFSELFRRCQRPIYRYAVHMCGPGSGDDIVQETFLAVLRQKGRFDATRGSVLNYLFGIARHLVIRRISPGFEVALEEQSTIEEERAAFEAPPTALDDLTRDETVRAVREAVRSLPPVYREAIVLCELEEMDYASAATVMACPIGTVRSRLHRARVLLAAKLTAMQAVPIRSSGL